MTRSDRSYGLPGALLLREGDAQINIQFSMINFQCAIGLCNVESMINGSKMLKRSEYTNRQIHKSTNQQINKAKLQREAKETK
jgi:hypothetical protein